jgi:hypothetical protein
MAEELEILTTGTSLPPGGYELRISPQSDVAGAYILVEIVSPNQYIRNAVGPNFIDALLDLTSSTVAYLDSLERQIARDNADADD